MKTIDFAEGNFEILAKIEKALEPLRKQTAYMGRITSNFKSEIIDDIPRWYRVKYDAGGGEEYLGWISKISVEK